MRKEFRSLISLEEALSIVLRRLPRATEVVVPLPEARGCILAEKVVSSLDVPGFSRASMDGFAVPAEETLAAREDRPICLRLAGSVPMGVLAQLQVARGEAAKIEIKGRHDPAIPPRIVPVAEAMVTLVLADHILRQRAASV
jgi:molybdopterin biosynthesis enzyme